MFDLVFELSRAAVIAGRIFDEDGEPGKGATVEVKDAAMQSVELKVIPVKESAAKTE